MREKNWKTKKATALLISASIIALYLFLFGGGGGVIEQVNLRDRGPK